MSCNPSFKMKFISLCPDGKIFVKHSLFEFEEHSFNGFEEIWTSQGPFFWLRLVLVLRRKFLQNVNTLLYVNQDDVCLTQFLKTVDYCFICIHNRFVLKDVDSAMGLISDMNKILLFTRNSFTSETAKCVYEKERLRDLFKSLTGLYIAHDKKTYFRELDLMALYNWFYICLTNVKSQYSVAPDLPNDAECIQNGDPYWTPFPEWNSEKFEPSQFERHLTRRGYTLTNALQVPNINIIFRQKIKHKCHSLDNEDKDMIVKDFFSEVKGFLFHWFCQQHNHCRLKILHSEKCVNPISCTGSVICRNVCETELKMLYQEPHLLECTSYATESSDKYDASTQASNNYEPISTFKRRHEDYYYAEYEKVVRHYFGNAKGNKRFSVVKRRLKDKLREKKLKNGVENRLADLGVYTDSTYCNKLYKRAMKKIHEELALRVPYTFQFWGQDESEGELENIIRKSLNQFTTNKKTTRDTGTNCNEITYGRIISPTTMSHLLNNAVKDTNTESVTETDITDVNDSNCCPIKSISKDTVVESIEHCKGGSDGNAISLHSQEVNACVLVEQPTCSVLVEPEPISKFAHVNLLDIENSTESVMSKSEGNSTEIEKENVSGDIVETNESILLNMESVHVLSKADCTEVNMKEQTNVHPEGDSGKFDDAIKTEKVEKDQKEICEEFLSLLGTAEQKLFSNGIESKSMKKKSEKKQKHIELRICAFCLKQEEERRSFMKCALCKRGHFKEQRYYCSKECQSEDWREQHRNEHKNNKLV